jgi:hypothetical protein
MTHIKLTFFADDILIIGNNTEDLTFNQDRVNGSILPSSDQNRLIVNKDKSQELGFHHKSNKHIVFPDIVLKGRQVTDASEIKHLGVWFDHSSTGNVKQKTQ